MTDCNVYIPVIRRIRWARHVVRHDPNAETGYDRLRTERHSFEIAIIFSIPHTHSNQTPRTIG